MGSRVSRSQARTMLSSSPEITAVRSPRATATRARTGAWCWVNGSPIRSPVTSADTRIALPAPDMSVGPLPELASLTATARTPPDRRSRGAPIAACRAMSQMPTWPSPVADTARDDERRICRCHGERANLPVTGRNDMLTPGLAPVKVAHLDNVIIARRHNHPFACLRPGCRVRASCDGPYPASVQRLELSPSLDTPDLDLVVVTAGEHDPPGARNACRECPSVPTVGVLDARPPPSRAIRELHCPVGMGADNYDRVPFGHDSQRMDWGILVTAPFPGL